MSTTYKIAASDGKEYGPVSLDDIHAWIEQGRVGAETRILRSDQSAWKPASAFPELQVNSAGLRAAPQSAAAAGPQVSLAEARVLEGQARSGASWFYWVAALSVINTVLALSGSGVSFVVGLGVAPDIHRIALEAGPGALKVALALTLLAAGPFALFGWLAHKRQTWSFILGMALYGLDAFLLLRTSDWLSLGFHVFVLFCLLKGYRALRKLKTGEWSRVSP